MAELILELYSEEVPPQLQINARNQLKQILEKSIRTVGLSELLNIFPSMLEGKLANKILVDVNK